MPYTIDVIRKIKCETRLQRKTLRYKRKVKTTVSISAKAPGNQEMRDSCDSVLMVIARVTCLDDRVARLCPIS